MSSLRSFPKKRYLVQSFIPSLALVVTLVHFTIASKFGTIAPWGNSFEIFNLISNVQVFYLLVFLGNVIIFYKFFFKAIIKIPTLSKNSIPPPREYTKPKQWFFFGMLLYLLGIFSLFHFSLLEPFVFLYLLILLIVYRGLSSIIQPEYTNFDFFYLLTPWNPSTKILLNNYVASGIIDIGLILLILFCLLLLLLFILDPTPLISEEKIIKFRLKKLKLDFQNQNHAKAVIVGVIVYVLTIFLYLSFNTKFLIGSLLFLLVPLIKYQNRLKDIQWKRVESIKIHNAFNFYLFFSILSVCLFILIKHATFIHYILFFCLLLGLSLISRVIKYVGSFFEREELVEKRQFIVNITYNSLYHAFFWSLVMLYIGFWIIDDPLEDLLIKSIALLILVKYGYKFINNLNDRLIQYILFRLNNLVITFFAISMLIFSLLALFTKFLIQNGFEIWLNWIFHFLLGDLGTYVTLGRISITKKVLELIHPTLEISIIPLLVSIYISIALAKYAVKHYGELRDNLVLGFVVIGMAIPSFILIVFLILIFSGQLHIFPSFGRQVYADLQNVNLLYIKLFVNDLHLKLANSELIIINLNTFFSFKKIDWLFHFVLPLSALSIFSSVYITKLLRVSLYDVMNEPYITSAKAYGFSEKTILNKHAFLNSLIPIMTFIGLMVGTLLTTMPIIEYITVWHGIGYFGLDALLKLNAEFTSLASYSVVLSVSMIIALMILFSNLIIDIGYAMIDPRVAY